jgi:hypothetical protein
MALVHIEAELQEIRRRLDRLDERGASANEIDELRARIRTIARHLGLDREIIA